jgi:hypothetical protein
MRDQSIASRHGLVWLGTTLSVGLIISTVLAMGAVERIKLANQTIAVKGCAERLIGSDVIVWRATFSTRSETMADAYKRLKEDLSVVLDYLQNKGVPEETVTASSISTRTSYARDEHGRQTDTITGYRLSQSVRVRSMDIEKITQISRECTDLIAQGVEIDSATPQYFYTKLGELKIEMLGEAARDARQRTEQLARDSGSRVGALRSASQGVFQITPADSTEVSNYGISDTSSISKKIRAVISVKYSIR